MRVSEWVTNFLSLQLIWLIFNVPIVYLALDMLFRTSLEEIWIIMTAIFVMVPFILFPATAALYAIVRKWVLGETVQQLLITYWHYYKQNYVQSMFSGFIWMIVWFIWVMNYRLASVEFGTPLFYVYIVATFVFITLTNYCFADLVHFDIKFFQSMQKILYMTIFYFPYTLGAGTAMLLVLTVLYLLHPILLLLFSSSIIGYIYFFAYYQIYLKAKREAVKDE